MGERSSAMVSTHQLLEFLRDRRNACCGCPWLEFASGDTDLCCHDIGNERVIDVAVDPQPWCPLTEKEGQGDG